MYILNHKNRAKVTTILFLFLVVSACNPFHTEFQKEDYRYVYDDNSTIVLLENNTDTLKISPRNTLGVSQSDAVFGIPDIYSVDYIHSYLDLLTLNATMSVMRRGCTGVIRIVFSFQDSNYYSLDSLIYDTMYDNSIIEILEEPYTDFIEITPNSGEIQELVYCKDFKFIKLKMKDGYTLELIDILEE